MTEVSERLLRVRERVRTACERAHRSADSIRIVAVSKYQSTDKIRVAYDAGQRVFGENYAQELRDKAKELSSLRDIEWRFIGRFQSNKANMLVRQRAAVDTVCSADGIEALAKRSGRAPIEILLQVNVAGEAGKSGCTPSDVGALVDRAQALPGVDVRGLMVIPPATRDPEQSRGHFRKLRELGEQHGLAELSMGMSADFEVAIEEGATLVRVGTSIFGAR